MGSGKGTRTERSNRKQRSWAVRRSRVSTQDIWFRAICERIARTHQLVLSEGGSILRKHCMCRSRGLPAARMQSMSQTVNSFGSDCMTSLVSSWLVLSRLALVLELASTASVRCSANRSRPGSWPIHCGVAWSEVVLVASMMPVELATSKRRATNLSVEGSEGQEASR